MGQRFSKIVDTELTASVVVRAAEKSKALLIFARTENGEAANEHERLPARSESAGVRDFALVGASIPSA